MIHYVKVAGVVYQIKEVYTYVPVKDTAAKLTPQPPVLEPINWEDVSDWRELSSLMDREQRNNSQSNFVDVINRRNGITNPDVTCSLWSDAWDRGHSAGLPEALSYYDEALDNHNTLIKLAQNFVELKQLLAVFLSNGHSLSDESLLKVRKMFESV